MIDTARALLVWEPDRVVPTYAVPIDDIAGDIDTAPAQAGATPEDVAAIGGQRLGDRVVLDPGLPFSVHTTDGAPVAVHARGGTHTAEAFRPSDPALAGYITVDFDAFDAWYEEDERNVSRPRDPFHRIDILHSSRHVRIELGGTLLAESTRPASSSNRHSPFATTYRSTT